jgi:hypothetical protein
MRDDKYQHYVLVTAHHIAEPFLRMMRIRTISPNAAGRKYVRDNYASDCYDLDDGHNDRSDLSGREEREYAESLARKKPDIYIGHFPVDKRR